MDIAAWLSEIGLERYVEAFEANDIDAAVLRTLNADDLRELGVTSLGHRKKLLKAISALREPAGAPMATPAEAGTAATARDAERRQLTVLFCDLVGSTALAAELDPEDLREVIRAYHMCTAGVIGRFEGHVAKFLGDGVLAYFGYPRAHEDDAERAVRAGLALVKAVDELLPSGGHRLAARVGIATGPAVVGDLIGEGAAREEAVVGETPNMAARLQALAEPGAVVIAPTTRRLLGGLFDLTELGAHALKGFAQPVQAWRVVGEGRAESRFEALRETTRLTPLVGREHELGILLERWAWAKDGEGQVVLLSGEPGVGKSRIVRALRKRLSGESYTPLNHYCARYHVNTALHPVIDQLGRAANLARDEAPEQQLNKLKALLAPSAKRLEGAVGLIAALLAIPTADCCPLPSLTPQRLKQCTFEVLLEQVEGLAAERPVLLAYEDVHWIDPTSLELLDLLIDRSRRLPVLLVITFRPEFNPPWSGSAHVTQLPVNRLGRRQATAIVERLAGGKALPPEVLEQIVARTDGVPLFVEELTKSVLESGLLSDTDERYELAGPLRPLAIPATLHDSLMARLDRLGVARDVAQVCAVIGREFSHELLAAAAPLGEYELQSALEELVASELLLRRGTPPDAAYSFKHTLVQEVAYQSLLKPKRQQLHARVAAALEEHLPETANVEPEILAHHCTEARLAERAVVYWSKAGHRAAERSAYAEATAHLRRGLELLKTQPECVGRDHQELDLLTALGSILFNTKGHPSPDVAGVYLRARELCHALGDTPHLAPVLQGLRIHRMLRAELRLAREAGEELLALADRVADNGYRLEAHRALGVVAFYLGDFRAAYDLLDHGVALYDAEVHHAHALRFEDDPGTTCLCYMARTLWVLGYPEQALTRIEEAVQLAETSIHIPSLVETLVWRADLSFLLRQVNLCHRYGATALALASEHSFPLWTAMAGATWGWAETQVGEGKAGIAALGRALEGLREIGCDLFWPYYQTLQGDALGHLGRPRDALAEVERAFVQSHDSDARYWDAELHRLQGEIIFQLDSDALPRAEACLRAAIEAAHKQSAKSLELRASISLARLWRDQGRRGEAHDLLAPAYGWFTEGFDTADLKDAKALLDELR